MIDGKSVAALIPARGGSKGLPCKNTLSIAGYPLVAWTILAALQSTTIDQVVVSSDDSLTLSTASDFGAVPLNRPTALAADTALTSEVIQHMFEEGPSFDILVLLQPTSPLRTNVHIDEALQLLVTGTNDAVVSVRQSPILPELMYRMDASGRLQPVVSGSEARRQDAATTYIINGAIYVSPAKTLALAGFRYCALSMTPYIMSEEDSIDIDDAEDFEAARILLEKRLCGDYG